MVEKGQIGIFEHVDGKVQVEKHRSTKNGKMLQTPSKRNWTHSFPHVLVHQAAGLTTWVQRVLVSGDNWEFVEQFVVKLGKQGAARITDWEPEDKQRKNRVRKGIGSEGSGSAVGNWAWLDQKTHELRKPHHPAGHWRSCKTTETGQRGKGTGIEAKERQKD